MQTMKFMVLSWTATEATILGVYFDVAAALAAAQAVTLGGGVIGAGYCPIVGSESMVFVQGTNQT